jgi:hypothetical protein
LITGILLGPISARIAVNSVCSSTASTGAAAVDGAAAAETGAAAVTPNFASNFLMKSATSTRVIAPIWSSSSSWVSVAIAFMSP